MSLYLNAPQLNMFINLYGGEENIYIYTLSYDYYIIITLSYYHIIYIITNNFELLCHILQYK